MSSFDPIASIIADNRYIKDANKLKQQEIRQSITCRKCVCSKCSQNCIYDIHSSGVCVGCRRCKESGITKSYLVCPISRFEKLKVE